MVGTNFHFAGYTYPSIFEFAALVKIYASFIVCCVLLNFFDDVFVQYYISLPSIFLGASIARMTGNPCSFTEAINSVFALK